MHPEDVVKQSGLKQGYTFIHDFLTPAITDFTDFRSFIKTYGLNAFSSEIFRLSDRKWNSFEQLKNVLSGLHRLLSVTISKLFSNCFSSKRLSVFATVQVWKQNRV